MLVLEAARIEKYYGERKLFALEELKIYRDDRIGIVGMNGAGKTTLLNILSGRLEPDAGFVKMYGKHAYIKQLEDPAGEQEAPDLALKKLESEFGVGGIKTPHMSGGEKTRLKIAQGLSADSAVLFADEPTCNLDIKGIQLLEQRLKSCKGALVLISHDRELLDGLCNKILEIENERIKVYAGNYSDYKKQKEMELDRQHFEYTQYVKERSKLEEAILDRKQRTKEMKKAPSRMGNSEARLHTRAVNAKKGKLDKAVKAMESRVDQLEKKEKPKELTRTKLDIQHAEQPVSRTVIRGKGLARIFGQKVLFRDAEFELVNGSKTAVIGDNGTGKTTLVRMILSGEVGVQFANGVKTGYFSQELDILDEDKTILENVMQDSSRPEAFVRTTLARLLFRRDEVHKKVALLSGGERVKVSFAKIFVKDVNVIILDEPTNYLDIYSQEALEQVLKEYEGTVLFISHDRRFIDEVADHILILEGQRLISYAGGYRQYREEKADSPDKRGEDGNKIRMVLETRLAEINGRLSFPSKNGDREALEQEFFEVLKRLKELEKR